MIVHEHNIMSFDRTIFGGTLFHKILDDFQFFSSSKLFEEIQTSVYIMQTFNKTFRRKTIRMWYLKFSASVQLTRNKTITKFFKSNKNY